MKRIMIGIALLLVAGCSSGSSDTKNDTLTVELFCAEAIKACSTVTQEQCEQIVADANKSPDQNDLSCAKSAKTCQDTNVCLTGMPDMVLSKDTSGGEDTGPTSRPVIP